MKTVGTFEAKTHLSQLLAEVERTGQGIMIQRRGKDVAAIVPSDVARESERERMDEVIEGFRRLRAKQTVSTTKEEIREFIDEGRKY
jgi:prevent-host-death family protein